MPLDLQAIKDREEMASRGPWAVYKNERIGVAIGTEYEHPQLKGPEPIVTTSFHGQGEAKRIHIDDDDAKFIAHARQDVPALIAEVERLNELIVKERKEHLLKVFEVIGDADKKLVEENERLRAALEFYGDIENYQLNKIGHGFLSPIVMADGGNKARKAVEVKKPARTPKENALIDKVIANLQALDGEK